MPLYRSTDAGDVKTWHGHKILFLTFSLLSQLICVSKLNVGRTNLFTNHQKEKHFFNVDCFLDFVLILLPVSYYACIDIVFVLHLFNEQC